MPELLVHFDETTRRFKRLWEIHFMIGLPMLLSMSLFDDFYRDLFGRQSAFDAVRLLQGFDNKTLETDRALWHLSRKALAVPAVRTVLEEQAAADVIPVLGQSSEGQSFLAELHAYLDEYGQRCASSGGNAFDPAEPSWIEDPTPVIKNLKDYITQPDRNLDAEMAKQATERERLLAEICEQLRVYPQPVVGQFRSAAQGGPGGGSPE
jgi:pyruvate,water dikinase